MVPAIQRKVVIQTLKTWGQTIGMRSRTLSSSSVCLKRYDAVGIKGMPAATKNLVLN